MDRLIDMNLDDNIVSAKRSVIVRFYEDIIASLVEANILILNYAKELKTFDRIRVAYEVQDGIVPVSIKQDTEELFDICTAISILSESKNNLFAQAVFLKSTEDINLDDYLVLDLRLYSIYNIYGRNLGTDLLYIPKNTKIHITPAITGVKNDKYSKESKVEIVITMPVYKSN